MSREDIDYETLNAYVDGELDAVRAADVMAAAARDPAVARELSALSQLKASLGQDASPMQLEIPLPRSRRRPYAIAACVALLVAVAVVGLSMTIQSDGRAPDVAWIESVHDSWNIAAKPVSPTRISGREAAIDPAAYIPDLSAAKLSIVHVASVRGPSRTPATLVGYRGTRGCKVSLIVMPKPDGFTDEMRAFEAPPKRGFSWRAGKRGYVVFAEGMAPSRLSLIARSVREASLRHLPLDTGARKTLAENRAKSPPCRA